MLIGLSGYAGSGKDTVAQILARHGYRRRAFADKLKELARKLDPLIQYNGANPYAELLPGEWGRSSSSPLSFILDIYGPDEAKKIPAVRGFYQRLGEQVRKVLGENVWVDAVMAEIDQEAFRTYALGDDGYDWRAIKVAFADCRYPNEAEAILQRGGQIWRIERAGVGPANGHESETALDRWSFDRIISNNGPIAQLVPAIDLLLS